VTYPSLNKDRKPSRQRELNSLFVAYQDGSERSNRRVSSQVLSGLDGDALARAIIEEQDRLIADKSGTPAIAVKSIHRSGSKKADEALRSRDTRQHRIDDGAGIKTTNPLSGGSCIVLRLKR
jgi:hypothetical protein